MFAMGLLGSIIFFIICFLDMHYSKPKARRTKYNPDTDPNLHPEFDRFRSLDEPRPFYITYPNPAVANLNEFDEFLKKNEYYVPKWWKLVQKEDVQFTPEQTKLIENYITMMYIKTKNFEI